MPDQTNEQLAQLQNYQLEESFNKLQGVIREQAGKGIPPEVVSTALMITFSGVMAVDAVYKNISHEDAQGQLAEAFDQIKRHFAKVYSEVEEAKTRAAAEKADQPDWMNPERMEGVK